MVDLKRGIKGFLIKYLNKYCKIDIIHLQAGFFRIFIIPSYQIKGENMKKAIFFTIIVVSVLILALTSSAFGEVKPIDRKSVV